MSERAKEKKHVDDLLEETKQRVLYSCFLPAVRLARKFEVPVKELGEWLEMAYYHETKKEPLKMHEVANLMKISIRKVAQLSKRLRQNFLVTYQRHELPRRIEFMLWVEPLSYARIRQALSGEKPKDIRQALDELIEQGRVVRTGKSSTSIYQIIPSPTRLVRDQLFVRIDGLNNMLSSVINAVYARFFTREENAFARTVTLRIKQEQIQQLQHLYEDVIWKKLCELDEAAQDDLEAHSIDVSIAWAPYDFIKNTSEKKGMES